MQFKKGMTVRARREMGDVLRGYVRRNSEGEVIEVHHSLFGISETKYKVRFPNRTVDDLTEDDIARVW